MQLRFLVGISAIKNHRNSNMHDFQLHTAERTGFILYNSAS